MRATILIVILLISGASFSQEAKFRGKVIDKATDEGIPFAAVILSQNEHKKHATACNIDGNFSIKDLKPGKYELYTKVVGYEVNNDISTIMNN